MTDMPSGQSREELEKFLASAPPSLRGWAQKQLDAMDRSEPVDELAAAPEESSADVASDPEPEDAVGLEAFEDDADAPLITRKAKGRTKNVAADTKGAAADPSIDQAAPANQLEADLDAAVGLDAFEDDADAPLIRKKAKAQQAATPSGKAQAAGKQQRPRTGRVNKILVVLLAAAIAVIIQQQGAKTQTASSSATASAPHGEMSAPAGMESFPAIDQAKVDELKAKIDANPDDLDSIRELATLYYNSGLYQDSATWQQKILDKNPDDLDALLALGVLEFNTDQLDAAEKHWTRATELAPQKPEPWFNLGFLYMAQIPPNYDKAEQAWTKVTEVAPNSELAQTAQSHLDRSKELRKTPASTPSGG